MGCQRDASEGQKPGREVSSNLRASRKGKSTHAQFAYPGSVFRPGENFILRRELAVYNMRDVALQSGKGTARSRDSYHCLFASIS
jgi:hypothetical protein